MSPENWVRLLVGVGPKDTIKPKIRRRKDLLLLAARKQNTGDLSQSSVSQTAKLGRFKLRVHAYSFMKGFEQSRIQHRVGAKVGRVQALVD